MTELAILGGLVLAVFIFFFLRHRKRTKILLMLREGWGKIPKQSFDTKSSDLFYKLNRSTLFENSYQIDDATWHDLDLSKIFSLTNRTISPVGSQYLYYMLRHPILDRERLTKREKLISDFSDSSHLREQVQLKLHQLSSNKSSNLPYSLCEPLPEKPFYASILPFISFTSLVVLTLTLFGFVHFVFPIFIFLINLIIRTYVKPQVDQYLYAFSAIGELIQTAKQIAKLNCNELLEIQKDLNENLKETSSVVKNISTLSYRDELGITEYLNIYFLWDVSSFYIALNKIKQQLPELKSLYKTVGYLDASLSIASFRKEFNHGCKPQFNTSRGKYDLKEIYNPLLDDPVNNSFEFSSNNILITGSNMAGKTTFLKTLGVNAILAQTINWTMAKEYEAPFIKVISSIGREENLVQGKSYYMAEVESILGIVKASQTDNVHLFILDEIYRGTNSTERLAASIEVLKYLDNNKDYILVATHDLQLSEELEHKYLNFHFQENVSNDGLSFDYKLRSGVSKTRNAIALLKHVGYPQSIVDNAFKHINN